MADTVVTTGRVLEASALTAFYDSLFIALYTNLVAVTPTTTLGALTEASFPGYSRASINGFGAAFLNASNQGEIDSLILNFVLGTTGGPYPIYGYFLMTAASGGTLVAVGPNPSAPVYLTNNGDTYSVQPRKVQGDLC